MNIAFWKRLDVRTRVYVLLAILVAVSGITTLFTIWYTYRMEGFLETMTGKHLAAFQSAEELESALVNQKGFVSYYFLDGEPKWLQQLGEYRQIFRQRLEEAAASVQTSEQRETIRLLTLEYDAYIAAKDQVIELYRSGKRQDGLTLHATIRDRFFTILDLCERYKTLHREMVLKEKEAAVQHNRRLRESVAVAIALGFVILVALTFFLIHYILGPVEELVAAMDRGGNGNRSENMVMALQRGIHTLIEDVDQAQLELEKSRAHLVQSEKLALVGKLAAGMAHSIRNPFTSVKMRLFSLSRSLELSTPQQEDFDVISEEIRHIDTIVQNFLEFSRPPKLKMQPVSPSQIVDQALQLLSHRLKSYDVTVSVSRKDPLPDIFGDPEQLKEVFVNIIVNACEAMRHGGEIVIGEERGSVKPTKAVAVIRLSDNGPGIPEELREKVFQPFFTTKEDGTGLGLSIAARIIEEHRGRLDVLSREGGGTTFIITLPLLEDLP